MLAPLLMDLLLVGFSGTPSQAAGVSDVPEQPASLSRGFGSWVQDKLSGRAGMVLDKVMDAALDALDGPLQVRSLRLAGRRCRP